MGFGSHTFPDTEAVGIGMTTTFNLIVPTLLLGMGVAQGIDALSSRDRSGCERPGRRARVRGAGRGLKQLLTIFWRALVRALAGLRASGSPR
jgi:hypothetical protein